MVEVKVRKFGKSLGVILPREVLARLDSGEGSTLFLVESPDGGFRLTASDPLFEQKPAKADSIMERNRNTLRQLAK